MGPALLDWNTRGRDMRRIKKITSYGSEIVLSDMLISRSCNLELLPFFATEAGMCVEFRVRSDGTSRGRTPQLAYVGYVSCKEGGGVYNVVIPNLIKACRAHQFPTL